MFADADPSHIQFKGLSKQLVFSQFRTFIACHFIFLNLLVALDKNKLFYVQLFCLFKVEKPAHCFEHLNTALPSGHSRLVFIVIIFPSFQIAILCFKVRN